MSDAPALVAECERLLAESRKPTVPEVAPLVRSFYAPASSKSSPSGKATSASPSAATIPSDAWDEAAEHKAREHLRGMLTDRQWRHYDLTGSFLETSPRSGLTYLFRRLRPTIALSPRGKDGRDTSMRCLAVLCLHPIGYYARSWGGCLVPSDDVVAHLAMCRADEAYYWRCANQHQPSAPEAGM